MKKVMLLFGLFVFMLVFVFSGCSKDSGSSPSQPAATPTPVFTLIHTPTVNPTPGSVGGALNYDVSLEGKQYFVVIDNNQDETDGYLFIYNNLCTAGNFTNFSFQPNFGLGSNYYVYAVVDMDNSGTFTPGDYLGYANASSPFEPPSGPSTFLPNTGLSIDMERYWYNVTVNVTMPGTSAGDASIGLFSESLKPGISPEYGEETLPSGNNFSVTLYGVEPGTYILGGFADADGSDDGDPSYGDYVGVYNTTNLQNIPSEPNLNINGNMTVNLTMVDVASNVNGTITAPGTLTGSPYVIYVSTGPWSDGYEVFTGVEGTTPASGTSFGYDFFMFYPGTYYVTALVDNDASGFDNGPTPGDYAGICGVTPPIADWEHPYPVNPSTYLPGSNKNITCDTVPGPQ
ncbi:MAG TPA: hypothetical protein PLB12_08810 [Candidatus Goldiibacteriota bacterium]|nr:hypothetical protein [Candidatus Goldiibacteriota bacterium]HPN63723.1 hypothetical protein [Candidatus Goldiibacteriota bacterium]HRQ44437.1 hypothetical protein [Candidatus Goldiibacteriota bacterium]